MKNMVHRLVLVAKQWQPSYITLFLFHLYYHRRVLRREEEALWEAHLIMLELKAMDSELEEHQEEEDMMLVSEEEDLALKRTETVRKDCSLLERT